MLQTVMMGDPHGDLTVKHALTTHASAPLQANMLENLASKGATLSEPYADIIEMLPPTASRYPRSEVEAFIETLACGTLPRTKAYRKIRQDMGISKCVSCRAIKPFACFHVKQVTSSQGNWRHASCAQCSTLHKRAYRRACAVATTAVMPDVKLTRSGNVAGGMSCRRLREMTPNANISQEN